MHMMVGIVKTLNCISTANPQQFYSLWTLKKTHMIVNVFGIYPGNYEYQPLFYFIIIGRFILNANLSLNCGSSSKWVERELGEPHHTSRSPFIQSVPQGMLGLVTPVVL